MANPEHVIILKKGVEHWNQWREENPKIVPNLMKADLTGMNLSGVNLTGAYLDSAKLRGANLSSANLTGANFVLANLCGVNLTETVLLVVDFNAAKLNGAKFNNAFLHGTRFTKVDLSKVKGLETCHHDGPSSIDQLTLIQSGKLPDAFLRGCGFPDQFIEHLPSLIGSLDPIQFYSCFISYSSKDDAFTKRLHADLQANKVRCWFAPEDLKIGDKIRPRIDEVIHVHDKLLLVLSEESVNSEWVEKEVETAFEKERERKETVLFPIRLDDAVMDITTGWPADIRRSRHIGDFTQWKDHDFFKKAFDHLLKDLGKEG
jgi:TIR domain-containing protein/pentapeptide repeat protein